MIFFTLKFDSDRVKSSNHMHILEASAALKLIRTRTVTELILKNKKQHASSTFPDAVALEPLRNFSLRREPSKILEIVFQVAL